MNFFVKLSQNKKVVVPLVVVIGLAIFSGGYFVNDNSQVAKQTNDDDQAQTETKQDQLEVVEPVEKTEEQPKETETEDLNKSVSSDDTNKERTEYEELEMEVEYEGMTVTATVETDKAGMCYILYKTNDDKQGSDEVSISNGVCTFENVRTGGNITVKFISDDQSQKAIKTID